MDKNFTDEEGLETFLQNKIPQQLDTNALRMLTGMAKEHHQRLQRYVYTLCHDEALCNDLVQDTFLAAQQQMERGTYIESGKAYAWLCAIAKNLLMDHYRRDIRCNEQLSLHHTQICENLGWSSDNWGDVAIYKMFDRDLPVASEKRRKRISDNIGILMKTRFKALSLSDEERDLLCLRYCNEKIFRDLSARSGEPLSTVMSRYYTTLRKVRKQLMDMDAQGLFEKELSLPQMNAYIRRKESCIAPDVKEARQRDRLQKIVAYARRNNRRDDPEEGVLEVAR